MDIKIPDHNPQDASHSRSIFTCIVGLGVISAVLYLVNFRMVELVSEFSHKTDIHGYLCVFMFLSIVYLLGVLLIFKNRSVSGNSRSLLCVILFFAVFFRICLIPESPAILSNDIYRYVWDGQVQQNGINPYRYPPAAVELMNLRDDRIFPHINRKDYPTIYPAGAQLSFRIFYALVGDSVSGYKGFMVFFDILTLVVLTALLRAYGFESSRVIIYAWNPLVIFEIAYSGHTEGLMVFFMVSAFYLHALKKNILATVLMALSSAVKLYPALLLPTLLYRGQRIKGSAIFFAILVLLYLPYITAGSGISGFLPIYLKNPYESFNLGIKYLIMHLFPFLDYYMLSQLFILALLAAGTIIFFKAKQQDQALRYAYILVGLLIILMPASLHPWYVILIIPFLTFYPSTAWLIFSCAVTLSYLKYASNDGIMPAWVLIAEYLPLFVILSGGFILKKYYVNSWIADTYFGLKNEELAEVQK